jgi:predicted AAA+ superfamily ATPase
MLNKFTILYLYLLNQFSKMDQLLVQSRLLATKADLKHLRFIHQEIHWEWRLIGIKGARGVGKTTLLLQRLRMDVPEKKGIYLLLDDLHFASHTLRETVEYFRASGITHFFLDEVHKYSGWSREIKNLYDLYADIFVVFTGSSIIELNQLDADLSRRAVLYELPGLSFREYLQLTGVADVPSVQFEDIIARHEAIALELSLQFRPLAHFSQYLKEGYYPYFLENRELYPIRVKQVIRLILETDLATAEGGRVHQIRKISQLLQIIADSVPFKPNIQQLAAKVQLDRNTLIRYLHHLENARLIALLFPEGISLSALQKPEKIFLNNSNLAYVLSSQVPDIGNMRETFFYNQTNFRYAISYSPYGDFRVEDRWTVEVGGKTKGKSQIAAIQDSFLALDQIEIGSGKRIPLWLFGLMY